MGQAPLDLPDPLQATPLANAGAADDLLSQIAGDEIDRLLAEAEEATEDAAVEEQAAATKAVETRPPAEVAEPERPTAGPASTPNPTRQSPEVERCERAVSSFVADGDPKLEAELDNLLANLNGAPISRSDSEIVAPPEGNQAVEPAETFAAEVVASATQEPAPGPILSAEPAAPNQSPATVRERRAADHAAEADPLVKGELDQVFDKMTASADAAPQDSPTTSEPAKPAGSIDLLKVLDPIVADDAAKAEQAAVAAETGTRDEDGMPPDERLPIYVLVLEWVNAPLGWLPPAVRDAMGKIGILTLINAAAVMLYVLLFRRK